MPGHGLGHRLRQLDVVRDHPPVARGSRLPQGEPHFEGPEAARVLRAVVDVVRRMLLEMIVGRVVREGGAERLAIAHKSASGLERRVEPLVRIDRDGISQAESVQIVGRLRKRRRKTSVRAIHVKPRAVLLAERADDRQRIDGACTDRPGGADDHARHISRGDICLDLPAQGGHVHAEPGIGRDPPDRVGAEPADVRRFLNPGVCFRRSVDAGPSRAGGHAPLADMRAGPGRTRGKEAHEVRHVPAADEQPAAIGRVADELGDPSHCL